MTIARIDPPGDREISLPNFDAARAALERAVSVDEVKDIRDQAQSVLAYLKQQRVSLEMQNAAAEIKLRAERKLGEMLAVTEKNVGTRGQLVGRGIIGGDSESPPISRPPTYADLDIDKKQASRWQRVATVPIERFESWVDDTKRAGKELTSTGLVALAGSERYAKKAALYTSGTDGWGSPIDVIERARRALGRIDLDPCALPDEPDRVGATRSFTEDEDGLAREWPGRVYMNPPYGQDIDLWVSHLREEYESGRMDAAIALVPCRTDTAWWRVLERFPVCLVYGRLKFGDAGPAPFPSAVFFLGEDAAMYARFQDEFSRIGAIWRMVRPGRRGERERE